MGAHTPGPWNQRQQNSALRDEIGVRGKAVALVWVRRMPHEKTTGPMVEPDAEGEANARLIAAAPDLLAKVQQYASECGECEGEGSVLVEWEDDSDRDPEWVPCAACQDIRDVIALASPATTVVAQEPEQ
jgi:hypothetical protein